MIAFSRFIMKCFLTYQLLQGESQGLTRSQSFFCLLCLLIKIRRHRKVKVKVKVLRRDCHERCARGKMGRRTTGRLPLYPSHRAFRRDAVVVFRDRSVTAYKHNNKRRLGTSQRQCRLICHSLGPFYCSRSTRYSYTV